MPVTSDAFYNILIKYFSPFIKKELFNSILTIADTSYETVDSKWLRDMVLSDPILAPLKYRRDIFDCDDYVLYLKTKISLYAANTKNITRPFAVGYIFTTQHAFNFGLNNTNKLYILNTQSDNRDLIIPKTQEECSNFLKLTKTNLIQHLYI